MGFVEPTGPDQLDVPRSKEKDNGLEPISRALTYGY